MLKRSPSLWILAIVAALVGCAGLQQALQSEGTERILIEEAVDTAGYTLGLIASEKPEFRQKIETYYEQLKTLGLSTTVANAALGELKDSGMAYQVLAYKLTRIVKLAGGIVDEQNQIEDFGQISIELIELGKLGYLAALQNAGAKE